MLNEAMNDKTDMTLSEFVSIVDPGLKKYDRFCAACGKMLDDGEIDEIDENDVMHICGVGVRGMAYNDGGDGYPWGYDDSEEY